MPALKNPVHERFAKNVADGLSLVDSYIKAKGREAPANRKNAAVTAHGIRKKPHVDARIMELAKIPGTSEEELPITKAKVLKMLADMLEMSPEEASLSSNLCDLKYVGKMAMPVAIPTDRIRTLERVSKILGLDKETLEVQANEKIMDIITGFEE